MLGWAATCFTKPSVLDRRVGTGPTVTHFDPTCAQTMPHLPKPWSQAHGSGAAMEELWQTDVITVIKESTFSIRHNK